MAADMVLQVVVSPLLGVLFDNLGSLIQKEVGLVWGVDKELQKLATTLSTIRDVLEDAENKQIADKAVANWLLKLRHLAYDADDILDEWDMEARELRLGTEDVACSKQVCLSYFSCFNFAQVAFRRKIARRVNDLREKFDAINLERSSFHLSVGIVERRLDHYQNRETSSLPTNPDVYGRDEEKNFIITCLLNNTASEEGVSVHPIVGIGGLGKTTLAQVCYNDRRVQKHFDIKIWVCVSDDFDVKRLTRTVINSIAGETCNFEELDLLQQRFQEKLAHKRFLLVLDDVWNEDQEKWDRFKNPLSCGAAGSSVIVTTRLNTVATITGTQAPLFLKLLSEDDCWSLFKQRAFGMGNNESPNLIQIGQEIVGKCAGVPLVAKVLGGLLRFKRSEKEWLNIRDSRIWELPQSDGNTILPALRLSYIHLAPHLRQCFTYCAVFPKDHVMKKNVLIRLWMANGFIQSKREMQMEDIGDEIFNELSWRSLFQNEEKNEDGVVVSCMMHDLIHDLACSINLDECCHLDDSTLIRDVKRGTRHLSITCKNRSSSVFGSIYERAPNLRTLLLLSDGPNNKFATKICMKSLRVLDLKRNIYRFEVKRELLDSLCNLKHLRYLDLSDSDVKLLPESLWQLRNLQTLELEGCDELEKLPKHMGKMISLRHLNIEGCDKLNEMPVGMGNLIWLHTLSWFIVGPGEGRGIKELQELNYLSGEIGIKGLEHVKTKEEAKEANLMGKPNLVSLVLSWDSSDVMFENHQNIVEGLQPHPNLRKLFIRGYRGLTIPNWLDSLQNLVEISIFFECSGCEQLPSTLGTLPLLMRLHILKMDSLKFFFNDDNVTSAYRSLTYLQIRGMEHLEDWFPRGIERIGVIHLFPCLQELIISNCPRLKTLPPIASSSSSLQTLSLELRCNPAMLGSIQNLPSLSSLRFRDINDIIRFPEESLQNLPSLKFLGIWSCESLLSLPSLMGTTSLTDLEIYGCRSLTNVSLALRHQTSLQILAISGCPKAEISAVEYQHLTSLRDLTIGGIHELTNLPDGLQHLSSSTLEILDITGCSALNSLPDWIGSFTNLKDLTLQYCENLRSLPDGIQQLTNLKKLILYFCKNLRSLPDGIQQLTNLETLWIGNCHPELHGRCEKHTGEDWPKIKHIPDIYNKSDIYSLNGRSSSLYTQCTT